MAFGPVSGCRSRRPGRRAAPGTPRDPSTSRCRAGRRPPAPTSASAHARARTPCTRASWATTALVRREREDRHRRPQRRQHAGGPPAPRVARDASHVRSARASATAANVRAPTSVSDAPPPGARCAATLLLALARDPDRPPRRRGSGYWPIAVSPESMIASAPSNTALATSLASARVGRGASIIDSSIWVATIVGMPRSSAVGRAASG